MSSGRRAAIPRVEVDLTASAGTWGHALRPHRRGARALLRAFNRQAENTIAAVASKSLAGPLWRGLKTAASALHRLLGSHYGSELAELSDALGLPASELIVANVAYDIAQTSGCSALAVSTAHGPLHARNLEWDLGRNQLLQRHVIVTRVRNAPAGDYAHVTWPGLFGALTGVARARFSVSVNYVVHRNESAVPLILRRAASGYWPVTWAVRQALDEARDFTHAVALLKSKQLLSPVLFTVVGTQNDDRVVIERGVDSWALRKPDAPGSSMLVTNHYVSPRFEEANVDLSEMDTLERMDALRRLHARGAPSDAGGCLRHLSDAGVLRPSLQHQVVMRPRDGMLVVRVPGRPTCRLMT